MRARCHAMISASFCLARRMENASGMDATKPIDQLRPKRWNSTSRCDSPKNSRNKDRPGKGTDTPLPGHQFATATRKIKIERSRCKRDRADKREEDCVCERKNNSRARRRTASSRARQRQRLAPEPAAAERAGKEPRNKSNSKVHRLPSSPKTEWRKRAGEDLPGAVLSPFPQKKLPMPPQSHRS